MARLRPCPDCGAAVSPKAPACPRCGRPLRRAARPFGCGGCLVGLAAAGVIAVMVPVIVGGRPGSGPTPPSADAVSPPAVPAVGSVVTVGAPGDPDAGAWFAADDEAWARLLDSQNARDPKLLGDLMGEGRMFREPSGSRVEVLARGPGAAFCRVASGANVGRTGWTHAERLRGGQP